MDNLRFEDRKKARLFRGAISREQAGLPPIVVDAFDWRRVPALRGEPLRQFWHDVFADDALDLAGTFQSRVFAAWRILRTTSIVRGVIEQDEPITAVRGDPNIMNPALTSYKDVHDALLKRLLAPGVSLVPPDHPPEFLLESGDVSHDYDEAKDEAVIRFARLVDYVGQTLGLDSSRRTCRGFAWLRDPARVRAGWPPMSAIIRHETALVIETLDLFIKSTKRAAASAMMQNYDLSMEEAIQLTHLAQQLSKMHRNLDDVEGFKAVQLDKMDYQYERLEEGMDHRGAADVLYKQFRIFSSRPDEADEREFESMDDVVARSSANRRKIETEE